MWTQRRPSSPPIIDRLQPDDVLYFYDGPVVFSIKQGFYHVLFSKVDELEESNIFIGCQVSRVRLNALKSGKLSLRGALQADEYVFLEVSSNMLAHREWHVSCSDVPRDFFPETGVGLLAKYERTPDQIGVDPFLSYYYKGKRLTEGQIPLIRFKSIFDNTYESVTRIFDKGVFKLAGSKQRPSFRMFQPVLASLGFEIGLPDMIGDDLLNDIIQRQRDAFFESLYDVVDHAQSGSLEYGFAAKHFDTLVKVNSVVPGGRQFVGTLELTPGLSSKDEVVINEAAGERIKRAFAEIRKSTVQKSGVIVEINDKSKTFIVKNENFRLLTCVFSSAEEYRMAEPKLGQLVTLNGRFVNRERRDLLYVQGEIRVRQ